MGRTYAGVDGYCPLAAYLGSHGFCLELALRPGVQHSSLETPFNFERVIPMAQRLSAAGPKAPILLREDSGFDCAAQMQAIESYNRDGLPRVDWLISSSSGIRARPTWPSWPRGAMRTLLCNGSIRAAASA